MTEWVLTVGCLALILTLMTTLVIWSRKETVVRASAVLVFLLGLPVAGTLALGPLSRPAPEWVWSRGGTMNFQKGTRVLAFKLRPDVAIYLWIEVPGEDEPRYVSIPWNRPLAEKLVEMRADPRRRDSMYMTDRGVLKPYDPPQPPRGLKPRR